MMNIAFIGGGNMASAIVSGLLRRELRCNISVVEPSAEQRNVLRQRFPSIQLSSDSSDAVSAADLIVLAVKPQILQDVAAQLGIQENNPSAGVVSIAAGISHACLRRCVGETTAIVRAMPNQPAIVGSGMSVLHAGEHASQEHRHLSETVLGAVGETLWVSDETMIDAATAISGSGPAYFYLLMELLIDGACEFGFSQAEARQLVLATASGAARSAADFAGDISELRASVTSPGGTTQAAIGTLQSANIRAIVLEALAAARDRARELAQDAEDNL